MMNTNKTKTTAIPTPALSVRARIGRTKFVQKWMDIASDDWHTIVLGIFFALAVLSDVLFGILPLTNLELPSIFYNGTAQLIAAIVCVSTILYGSALMLANKCYEVSSDARYNCEDIYRLARHYVDTEDASIPSTRNEWFEYMTSSVEYFSDYREYTRATADYKIYKAFYNTCKSALNSVKHIDDAELVEVCDD